MASRLLTLVAAASLTFPAAEPPSTTTDPAPPPDAAQNADTSALASLPPPARSAVLRRAPFVYELPDGSIWDGFYYHEFRRVLSLYDSTTSARPAVPPDCKAWGFGAERRAPANREHRPHPLWTSPRSDRPSNDRTPFIYIDSTSPTSHERRARPHAKVGERLDVNLYEITITEFPSDDGSSDSMSLPHSFPYGFARLPVLVPPQLPIKPGDALKGEFFLIPDPAIKVPERTALSTRSPARLVFAKDLRMTPERYAAALLDGRAEMIEWSWKKERRVTGDVYVWTRTTVAIGAPAQPTPR